MRLHVDENMPNPLTELPRGENIVWQGVPDWKPFAIHAFHVRKLAIYFGVLLVWNWANGAGVETQIGYLTLAAIALGIVTLLAWAMARSTTYSITNKRIAMSFGVTMPMYVNIPFSEIKSIDLKLRKSGVGDIAICPHKRRDLSFFLTWPHVRAWRFRPVEPLLRCIPDATTVARGLVHAMQADADRRAADDEDVRIVHDGPSVQNAEMAESDLPPAPPASSWPAYAALGLVAFSLVSVFYIQSTKSVGATPAGVAASLQSDAVQVLHLTFEDQQNGDVHVFDAERGELLDTLPSGTNNFLRVALRGLIRARVTDGDTSRQPFILQRQSDGVVILLDPVTSRTIDLRAFGHQSAMSFIRFLDLQNSDVAANRGGAAGASGDASLTP
ncbi:MAG: photosynthetic complex putative assembly protein PuhB [Pseudomonadota bacterium]